MNDSDDVPRRLRCVLSHRYWQQRFNGNQAVVGKQVNLTTWRSRSSGLRRQALKARCKVGQSQDVRSDRLGAAVNGGAFAAEGPAVWWCEYGRLKPGATLDRPSNIRKFFQQSVLEQRAARQDQGRRRGRPRSSFDPKTTRAWAPFGQPGEMNMRQSFGQPLRLLFGVVLVSAADLVRQRSQSATGAWNRFAASGDCGAVGARCEPPASDFRQSRQRMCCWRLLTAHSAYVRTLDKDGHCCVASADGAATEDELQLIRRLILRVPVFTFGLSLDGRVFGLVPAWRPLV